MKDCVTVSLCIIAKDEEEHISACLNSARHLSNEIIVVDTGSEDRTVQLALAAGAKVLHFPWTGDFSQARNFALEHATSHWILFLDADEELEPVNREDLNRLLCQNDIEGYFLTIISYLNGGQAVTSDQVVRLFRNKPIYRFQGAIHEQVAQAILAANHGQGLASAPVTIRHHGYLQSQILKKQKSQRNMSILRRELEQKPDDPFLLYCLAVECYQQSNIQEGLACLQKALRNLQGSEGYLGDVICQIAWGLFTLQQWEQLISFTNKTLQILPLQTDLLLVRGLGHYHTGCYREAAEDLARVIQQGGWALPPWQVLGYLGDACNLTGDYTQAEKAYFAALSQSTKFLYPLTQLLGLVQRGKSTVSLSHFSSRMSFRDNPDVWQKLIEDREISLALVVMLLAIHEIGATGGHEELSLQLSREFSRAVYRLKPLPARELSFDYLTVTAAEIETCAVLIAKGCNQDRLLNNRLQGLIEQTIFFLIKEFCPQWFPHAARPTPKE